MEEKAEYNRKIKHYEKLGALKFQKVVFAVEKAKFKVLKKLFPNFIKYFDKYCDRKKKREIKRAKSKDEIKQIKIKYKEIKMAGRKEFYQEKNRNYHLNEKNPEETYRFLKWNKYIHQKNLKINFIIIPFLIAGLFIQPAIAAPLLAIELFSAGINFQCINIQNYNICRYKRAEKALLRRAERKIDRNIKEYGEATKVISKSIESSEDLPTFDEIINNIDDINQLQQMKELIKKAQTERSLENSRGNRK